MKLCLRCMEQYLEGETSCPHCGFSPDTAQSGSGLPLECILEKRYLVGCVLRSGDEMISYIGWDEYLQCKVEIQEYYPLGMVCRDRSGIDVQLLSGDLQEEFRAGSRRFLYEARRLVPYMHYSCMLKIIDTFQANHTIYIVRKYENGRLLSEYLKQKTIPEQKALQEINSILDFLSSFHAGGMLIGDLSPERILLTKDGALRIADCSQVIDVGTLSKQQEKATYNGFLPMEAASGHLTPVADVYAVGALLFAMLTGEDPPPPAGRLSHNTELVFPQGVKLSEMTETALHNALQPRAADRTQSTEQFRKELNGQGATRVIGGKVQELKDTGAWKRWHKLLLAGLGCLLVILAVTVGMTVRQRHKGAEIVMDNTTVRVPDVIGKTLEEAKALMEQYGLSSKVTGRIYNSKVEAGQIVAQSIEAGKMAEPGTVIELTICMGAVEPVELPNLYGRNLNDEQETLSHFNVILEERPSIHEAGVIFFQDPEAGLYDEGTEVKLYVSKGIEYNQAVTVEIGNYLDRNFEQVRAELEQDATIILTYKEENCPQEKEGLVLSQSLPAGSSVPQGTELELIVGIGPKSVLIKDYTAQNGAEVRAILESSGINVNYLESSNDQYAAGLIYQQSVAGGQYLKEGDTIDLYVSRGMPEWNEEPEKDPGVVVDNFIGMDLETANDLVKAQLNGKIYSEIIQQSQPSSEPAYTVLDQDPKPGTHLEFGDTIVFYLYYSDGSLAETEAVESTDVTNEDTE